MRNRPDSRGRLAGIRPPGPPDADDRAGAEAIDETLPVPGGDTDRWVRVPPAAHRRSEPDRVGGWVPELSDSFPTRAPQRQPQSQSIERPARPLHREQRMVPGVLPGTPRQTEELADPSGDDRMGDPMDDQMGGRVDDHMGDRMDNPMDDRMGDRMADGEPTVDDVADHRARRVRYSPHHAWGRVAQRWIPEPLREARIDPGRRGALLLTVVAAVAAVVAAVGVWRGQPEARPVQTVSLAQVTDASGTATGRAAGSLRPATARPATTLAGNGGAAGGTNGGTAGGTEGGATTAATTTGVEVLVVSVTGAVRHPGLVRLPPGSRVADAIAQAGGVTGAADLTGINLAARLTDGASVVVSDDVSTGGSSVSGLGSGTAVGPAPTTGPAGQPAGKVDLNTADATTLDALPGVGPVTAAAIVAWRNKNGRYTSVEQLQEIAGIGPAKYAALAALVTV